MKPPAAPPDKPYTKMNAEELEQAVRYHNHLYFVQNAPKISDYQFDRMVLRLKKIKPDSPVLQEITADLGLERPKVKHTSEMLSLEKAYSEEEVQQWAGKFSGALIASPKIDGLAIELRYDARGRLELAATRGDGLQGDLITENARQVRGIPAQLPLENTPSLEGRGLGGGGPIEIRGEVYMRLSIFKKCYQEQFANPRNLAAGAIKQKDPQKTKEYGLDFFAYDLRGTGHSSEWEKLKALAQWCVPTVESKQVERDQIEELCRYFLVRRDSFDYETDGVVFRADSVAEQERLGATAHHPRYSIAFKFQGESGVTTLENVEWSVARSQVITPIGVIRPVELSGARLSRVSLHNYGLMMEKGLTRGAEVVVVRRGGVIPYLESVKKKGSGPRFAAPKKCPSCGSTTQVQDEFLYCTNPRGCHDSQVAALEHFVNTVEIEGFGPKLLERLYENGFVTDPAEFYDLTKENLLELERMGEVLATKLIRNIDEKRTLDLATFLTALGIREIGRQVAKLLAQKFGTFERLRKTGEEELVQVETVGPVIAQELRTGLKKQQHLIEKLLKRIKLRAGTVARPRGKLAGKKFCFTGGMAAMSRTEGQKKVEALGGEAVNTVTKDLDYLIVGSEGGAGSKLRKAQKLIAQGLNLTILSEQDFLELVER